MLGLQYSAQCNLIATKVSLTDVDLQPNTIQSRKTMAHIVPLCCMMCF